MIFFDVLFLISILLMCVNRDRKKMFFLFMLIPLTLIFFNINTADKGNYLRLYNRVANGNFSIQNEIGMQFIMFLMVKLHISFNLFFNIFCAVALALMVRFFYGWTKKPTMVLLLYIIYPFLLDMIQIRLFMATAIVLNAVCYLKYFSKKNFIKFCLMVLLAFSFHFSAVFYLFFLMAYLPNRWIWRISFFEFVLFLVLNTRFYNLLMNIAPFVAVKLRRYMSASGLNISQLSLLFLVIMYILNNLICVSYIWYLKRRNQDLTTGNLIFKVNVLSIIFILFSTFSLEFMRLYRMVMLLNYTMAGNLMIRNVKTGKYRIVPAVIVGLIILSCGLSFYRYEYVSVITWEAIKQLFEKNYIWDAVPLFR